MLIFLSTNYHPNMYTIETSNKCITYHHYMFTNITCESQFCSLTNVPPARTQKRGGGIEHGGGGV